MKEIRSLIFSVLFTFPHLQSTSQNNQISKTVINVELAGIHEVAFNIVNENKVSTALRFRNPTRGDTLVRKYLNFNKPTHMFFANAEFIPETKQFKTSMGSLLILPGDSISLGQNGLRVVYSRHYNGFIDELIDIEGLYNRNQNKIKQKLASKGLRQMLSEINEQYILNENKIENFRKLHSQDIQFVNVLRDLNYLVKSRAICTIPVSEGRLDLNEKKLLDSCYKEIEQNIGRIENINSPFSFTILYYLTTYNALTAGKKVNDFWSYFTTVNKDLLNSEFYRSFLLNRLYLSDEGNLAELTSLVALIKKAGIKDDRYDSIIEAKIQLRSNEAYKTASRLKDVKGSYLNYFDLLKSLKGNYVFIDFWATWCGPCRAQMPLLNKLKSEFNDRIKFVAISIDENDGEQEWVAASKGEGLYDDQYNFRLEYGSFNKLLKILEFETVPRYLLYGPDGQLLSSEFTTPDKISFRQDLIKAIKGK